MNWTCACGQENVPDARFCNQCGAPRPDEQAAPPQPAPEPPPAAHIQAPPPAAPPAAPPAKKSHVGLVVAIIAVVALLGVCVLGIVAAIAVPNFLNAAQRAKQKRAMAEMQSLAAACQAYQADTGHYPNTGHGGDSFYSTVDVSSLGELLVPSYMKALPAMDPWDHPYLYGVSENADEFILICPGSDGVSRLEAIPQDPLGTHCFQDDIVWEDARFVQLPEGPQRSCK